MATKRFQQKDIINFLLQGGDISALNKLGVDQRSLMAAFISSPELVNKFRQKADTEGQPYIEYRSDFEYDPAKNINEVESKYYAMPEKYGAFAKDFWNQVKAVGANPTEVGRIKQKIDNNRDVYATTAGLTRDEFDELYDSLTKDVENFQSAESKREKAQYGAFLSKRKKLGITGEGTKAKDEFLAATTGVAGLTELPTSLDEFVKQKSESFVSKIDPSWSEQTKKQYKSDFESTLRKKVGKNYSKFAVRDLLKKNLLGE